MQNEYQAAYRPGVASSLELRCSITPTAHINIPDNKLEEFRLALRRKFNQYVFEVADAVGIPHQEIEIDGSIKFIDG
jgi:ABC-type uncharacterized transport system YnjBCD ATPase subunit